MLSIENRCCGNLSSTHSTQNTELQEFMKNRLLVQTGYVFSESDVSLLKKFNEHLSDYLALP